MKTLIELFDERPLENVLSTEMFHPEKTVFLCPPDVAASKRIKHELLDYFAHRGVAAQLIFIPTSFLDVQSMTQSLHQVLKEYPDCALDISGGSDAALFASGTVCAGTNLPVFTYSRKKNKFFEIQNAPFARDVPCTLQFQVEDFFLMAGGSMKKGRVDNAVLSRYAELIQPMFDLYMTHRREWVKIVAYMQRVSQPGKGEIPSLKAAGAFVLKSEKNGRIAAHEKALQDMEKLGLISELSIDREKGVSFSFRDEQIRAWLRDVGSMLELYTYQSCLETGLFRDVRTSVVVDWDGDQEPKQVTNEIDVMAARGVMPLFISCKTCDVKTEALNELAILRDRFGSNIARAAIVTAEQGRSLMRQRAQELNIQVIDLNDLHAGKLKDCLCRLAK